MVDNPDLLVEGKICFCFSRICVVDYRIGIPSIYDLDDAKRAQTVSHLKKTTDFRIYTFNLEIPEKRLKEAEERDVEIRQFDVFSELLKDLDSWTGEKHHIQMV